MFTRIVKMTFRPETIPTFLNNFEEVKERIRSFDGCVFLELYQDRQRLEVFFTYSRWQSEAHLEAYRNSELFQKVWGQTKPLFQEKAAAWSVNTLHHLP
ncbi:MAG TPA: antibiotic biosynthesis monooxygenase [Flavobacteriaceae bacterium]|nr:antibiotic biosynthesis monooxygenase [Flavobacteriaceae bacterium]MCB9213254.1 antibiotic biosynthesis monooxygenase [Alteromonas sp.]HPF12523.1 antibiotic biosynthesis monooxygenase [Flavobacteriaceae bacterium]HQU22440.1 antibiotic biosynthesis monooxygenase [Flavobacteriaceae bacterium]HQU66370.1 antibiotic biosynthesis monooxygenase [Flavobacteriaceae bacterium]